MTFSGSSPDRHARSARCTRCGTAVSGDFVQRLELAFFASSTYATLYQLFPDDPPGDPIYLCRALAMLDVSAGLATQPRDAERHRKHREVRQATLAQNHPDFHCPELHVEAAPAPGGAPVREPTAPPSTAAPVEQTNAPPVPTTTAPIERPSPRPDAQPVRPSSSEHLRRRVVAWTAVGGITLGLGVASFAVMGGFMSARERSRQRAAGYGPEITPEERRDVKEEEEDFARAGRLAIAAGVVGGVMAITGLASVIRGTVLRERLRLIPDVGAERAAFVLTGRF